MIAWQKFLRQYTIVQSLFFYSGFVLVDFSEDNEREGFLLLDLLVFIIVDFILLL